MEEDEEVRRQRNLLMQDYAQRRAELESLEEIIGEAASVSPFQPRASLARTPPDRFSPAPVPRAAAPATVVVTPPVARPATVTMAPGKRLLSSPEEVQEAVRRRTAKKSSAPPLGGILTAAPAAATAATPVPHPPASATVSSEMRTLDKEELIDAVHGAVKAISLVANATNKLNIGDKTSIAGHGQDIIALVSQLALRLAAAEQEVSLGRMRVRELEASRPAVVAQPIPPVAPSYASALKLPNGKAPMPMVQQGPAVLFYPTREDIKTSDDTKKVLQEAVKPAEVGIKVSQVRRVGNSGVVVRTATAEAAAKLRSAVPPGLRVAEPRSRMPRVALRYLRADVSGDALIQELHRINLEDDAAWPLPRFREECKFGVRKQLGPKYLVILECSKAARDKLIELGRVYVGWDEADVCDHLRVTCCTKCQQYGHPEKYCRAKEMTCGKCGETGHRDTECQSKTQYCATCRRFKRKDAGSHATASAACPARQHAEQQAANLTYHV